MTLEGAKIALGIILLLLMCAALLAVPSVVIVALAVMFGG